HRVEVGDHGAAWSVLVEYGQKRERTARRPGQLAGDEPRIRLLVGKQALGSHKIKRTVIVHEPERVIAPIGVHVTPRGIDRVVDARRPGFFAMLASIAKLPSPFQRWYPCRRPATTVATTSFSSEDAGASRPPVSG